MADVGAAIFFAGVGGFVSGFLVLVVSTIWEMRRPLEKDFAIPACMACGALPLTACLATVSRLTVGPIQRNGLWLGIWLVFGMLSGPFFAILPYALAWKGGGGL